MTQYVFDLKVDAAGKTMDYVCRACGVQEHGGGIPNVGVYARMKQHLVSAHSHVDAHNWQVLHEDQTSRGDAIITIVRR